VLFVHAPGARARGVVLQHLYQMSEGDFKRHWIAKTFRDHIASGPKIVSADGLAKRLTATVPGAVAVIPESEVDATVKVLTIDGRHPGDAGYPLVASAP
jgi:phosphate transport system substrate-binding protein